MKKIISILLTAVLLCTLLSVFVLPASAEELKWTGDKIITGGVVYKDDIKLGKQLYSDEPGLKEDVDLPCNLVILPDASVTFDGKFVLDYGSTVLIRDGATVTFNGDVSIGSGCTLTIEGSATVTFNGMLDVPVTLSVRSILIENGAVVTLNKGLGRFVSLGALRVCGTLTGKCESFSEEGILLAPGGTVDLEFTNEEDAKTLVENLQKYYQNPAFSPYTGEMFRGVSGSSVNNLGEEDKDANSKQHNKINALKAFYASEIFDPHAEYTKTADNTYRVTAHIHAYPGCKDCCGGAANGDTDGAGSILSGGSLTIVVGVAAFVFGLGVMFLVMKKKKKPVLAGENNE